MERGYVYVRDSDGCLCLDINMLSLAQRERIRDGRDKLLYIGEKGVELVKTFWTTDHKVDGMLSGIIADYLEDLDSSELRDMAVDYFRRRLNSCENNQ